MLIASFLKCPRPFVRPQRCIRCLSTSKGWQLSPEKRSNLIFGANTDVGKTLVSAGLVQASLRSSDVTYLKPLQCGHSDQKFVRKHVSDSSNELTLQTLFEWNTPASPHVASRLENMPVSDDQVKQAVQNTLSQQKPNSVLYLETAGGVLSPSSASPDNRNATAEKWGWQTQADLYQSFNLPVVLVGDGRLGGISATLAALEVLILRGYDIAAIVVIDQKGMDNAGALREYCERGLRSGSGDQMLSNASQSIVALPPIPEDPSVPLFEWYVSVQDAFQHLDSWLQQTHQGQLAEMQPLAEEAERLLWWPSTKSKGERFVENATGDELHLLEACAEGSDTYMARSVIDACDETRGFGHGDSSLTLAASAAAGRYGNIWYPKTVHGPAVTLAQRLAKLSGADRVLFSQDPPVELALYMGMKTYQMRQGVENPAKYDWAVCSQEGCLHGFTLGAMNAGEPRTSYLEDQHPWYECKSLLIEPPTLGFQNGVLTITCPEAFDPQDDEDYEFDSIEDAMDVTGRLLTNRRLHSVYKERIEMHWLVFEHKGLQRKIASVLIEPILSGQSFVDPLWQRALVDVAESRNVPIIFDEVRSGLYRVGVPSCREILQVDPDITCYGNHLSGGMVPLSAAATTQEVFDAFDEDEGLLCSDAFAGHPIGCASAIHTLDAYSSSIVTNGRRKLKPSLHMLFSEDSIKALSQLPLVEECFSLGTVLVVTIQEEDEDGDDSYHRTLSVLERLEKTGVLAKSVGNVIQITLPPLTHQDLCTKILDALHNAIEISNTIL